MDPCGDLNQVLCHDARLTSRECDADLAAGLPTARRVER